jgi:hypothetical protein
MNARVVTILGAALLIAGCRPRTVEVRTAPQQTQQTQLAVEVRNSLQQGVNVYASVGGTDTFLRQVAAGATVSIPLQGFAAGQSISLKAVTVDGVRTYQRQNVVLSGTYVFPLP